MSFSKCSVLETEKVMLSNFTIKEIKGKQKQKEKNKKTMISNKQNFETENKFY